jgi:hypothetical protein
MTIAATDPPTVAQLTEALKLLGCPVTVEPGAPPGPSALHLTRILVALAEQHAIRAEHAAASDGTVWHAVAIRTLRSPAG